MATENLIRMRDTTEKWSSIKEASAFATSSANMAAEDVKLLLKDHCFTGSGKNAGLNRSGSAPPSIEGSNLAIDNLYQRNFRISESWENSNSSIERCQSEDQLHADSSLRAHYCSNFNLNSRLSPLHISRKNEWIVHHIRSLDNKRGLTPLDDSYNISLHSSQRSLPTHKEEPEDDQSPPQPSNAWLDGNIGKIWSGQNSAPPAEHRDLQESCHGSQSPVYSHSRILSNEIALESAVNNSGCSSFLCNRSINTSNVAISTLVTEDVASSNADSSPILSSSSLDYTGSKSSAIDSGTTIIESEMDGLSIANFQNSVRQTSQEQWQLSSQEDVLQQKMYQQKGSFSQAQNANSQVATQGMNWAYIGMDQFLHSPSKFSAEVQPVLQSSGFTPPMYTTTASYMTSVNPYFPSMQAPGFFSPQYLGGYAMNPSAFPPYFAGYPPPGAVPLIVDGAAGSSYNSQTASLSTPIGISAGENMQHVNKFYGQVEYPLQPSFLDPIHMHYHRQPFGEPYGISGQYGPLALRGSVMESQVNTLDLKKEVDKATYVDAQKFQPHRSGAHGNLNVRRGVGPNFTGNAQNVNILMQYPISTLPSSVVPGSAVGGTGFSRGKNEMRLPSGSGRNSAVYPGWSRQRGFGSFVDPQIYNLLEELKSGKSRRFELSDITRHVVEFSADQHGSRFIQQKLETCSLEEKASVFKEVLPHASKLMTDVFGNYVIQKFFEYGSVDQRKELANRLKGQILPLSLQMYGCRVIQKALEVIELEQKVEVVGELDGHVLRCVRDQNGNHVIQKCIERIPTEKIGFIISAFQGQIATLSMHPYGCRVIQRFLEHCMGGLQCQFIVDEILESVCSLAQDQYGNYVTQDLLSGKTIDSAKESEGLYYFETTNHVLERGKPHERSQIIGNLSRHVVQLSQHKFASNVVEKCLEYGGAAERDLLVGEIIGHNEGNDNLLIMMKDQFANYVVQKTLEICTDNQKTMLLNRIRAHAPALKKYTYGKHIVARFEQLFGEENQTSAS